MSRPNPIFLTGILLGFLVLLGGLPVLKGGLYLDAHEGDSYHFLDILFRLSAGQVPHIDFSTPLGILAFLPIKGFLDAGHSVGMATVFAQGAVAAALIPLILYVGLTRLSGPIAYIFGIFTLIVLLSLSYGGATSGVTISMHYNRWSWAIAFILLALALVPARTERQRFDGALIGFLGCALLLIKITYFVAIVPVAAIALLAREQRTSLIAAVIAGLVGVLGMTLAYGPSFWLAYLSDLRTVAGNEIRPFVGVSLSEIISGPAFVGATVLGVAAALMIRRAGHDGAGSAMLLLIPGFVYITYQNFGNDPTWLLFLPVLLIALRPETGHGTVAGADLRMAMNVAAWMSVALIFPSLVNSAMSPVEHAAYDKSRFIPMLPEEMGHQDIFIRVDRGYTMTAQVFADQDASSPWAKYGEIVERPEITRFQGIDFPHCEWRAGSRAFFDEILVQLKASGVEEGARLFTTDILSAFWLFGPYAAPEKSAPWYYGDLIGLENADYLIIPKCSFVARIRDVMIAELEASEFRFETVTDNDVYALFRVSR